MDVVCLPEFSRCVRSAVNTRSDAQQVEEMLDRLSKEHTSSDMREELVQIPGSDIGLWATRELRLSGRAGRAAWRYEERNGRAVIVCFTFVHV